MAPERPHSFSPACQQLRVQKGIFTCLSKECNKIPLTVIRERRQLLYELDKQRLFFGRLCRRLTADTNLGQMRKIPFRFWKECRTGLLSVPGRRAPGWVTKLTTISNILPSPSRFCRTWRLILCALAGYRSRRLGRCEIIVSNIWFLICAMDLCC